MKSVLIIGAGVAGLSAGIHARLKGFKAVIHESHSLPGGMCAAWKRKGYLFEGCLHYVMLTGTKAIHAFYRVWEELGLLPGLPLVQPGSFHSFRDAAGRTLTIYGDADRLEADLLALSPADRWEIRRLCAAIRHLSWMIREPGPSPLMKLRRILHMGAALVILSRMGGLSLGDYAARFKDPLISSALSGLFVCPDFGFAQLAFILAGWHLGAVAYPEGGSLALARALEKRFLDLGGSIVYRSRVSKIAVEGGRARGLVLSNGSFADADAVIAACDGRTVLQEMLGGAFTPPALLRRYDSQPLYESFVQVSLGLAMDLCGTPHALKARTSAEYELAGRKRNELWFQHFAFVPGMAPEGKTALTVLYPTDFSFWEGFSYPGPEYKAEKERILALTVELLEEFLPGIGGRIETSDVATPLSVRRYTATWKGALGFVMTPDLSSEMTMKTQYRLPGISGFYLAGQWAKGFGLPTAALSGKEAVQAFCKDQKR